MEEIIIGVDIGGTAIKIGFITRHGQMKQKWEIPTNKENHGESIVEDIWESITQTLSKIEDENTVIGIGVGAPGFIEQERGFIYEAVNIGWKNFNLRDELHKLSGLPVFIDNDANLAALGENWQGSGNNSKDVILITLGTGVGGGIIANGEILNGVNGTAGEIGHIIAEPNGYKCNCGRVGCLDVTASATGFVQRAMDRIEEYPDSALATYYHSHGQIEAKDIFDLSKEGDQVCEEVINQITDILGYVIANTATIINPSKVLIGGGVSNAGEQLLEKVAKYFRKYALPRISDSCEVKLAQLGNDAGMIGAAYLVDKNLK
ncbi:MAG TPA: ROK family glucokinase [Atopostipes sp.]|nr:ROK family glucokinase [Atopostipes sp.]